jgi:hypothetical protein
MPLSVWILWNINELSKQEIVRQHDAKYKFTKTKGKSGSRRMDLEIQIFPNRYPNKTR